jgi:uncharacterized protein (DUF1499 family)
MKILYISLAVIVVIILIALFVIAQNSKSGNAPGLANGILQDCPSKPNCLCSENKKDTEHYIEPISFNPTTSNNLIQTLENIITELKGEIKSSDNQYLSATFSSPFMGFVDDVEFRIDPIKKLIHMRSASRVGHSDMGANKKRMELVKKLFNEKY